MFTFLTVEQFEFGAKSHNMYAQAQPAANSNSSKQIRFEKRYGQTTDVIKKRLQKRTIGLFFSFSWKVSELIINGLQRKDDGLYECQARNEGGQFFKSGHIQVSCCTVVPNVKNPPKLD